MIRPFVISVLCCLMLSACANMRTFDQTLDGFVGKPVNDVAIVFGPHDGQYATDKGETVYVWQDSDVESVFGPAVTSGGYQIGSTDSFGNAFIWQGVRFHSCVIRVTTLDGIVRHVSFEGDPGGCEAIHDKHREAIGRRVE